MGEVCVSFSAFVLCNGFSIVLSSVYNTARQESDDSTCKRDCHEYGQYRLSPSVRRSFSKFPIGKCQCRTCSVEIFRVLVGYKIALLEIVLMAGTNFH